MKRLLPSTVLPARIKAAKSAGDDYGVNDGPDWRGIDWSAHLHRTEVAGAEVSYVDIGDEGDHRPMLFIHGLSGQWQNWLENIPRFAQARRVVALDLPGFGRSEMPRDEISIELFGEIVAGLSEQLELGSCVVVGNSMGGFVAAELAIRRPELVERLMLLASAGVSQVDLAHRPIRAAAKALGLVLTTNAAQASHHTVAARPALRHAMLAVVARHPSRLAPDLAFEGLIKGAGTDGFEDGLRACLEYDFRERLPQIGCPTLIIWGEKDMIIPVEDADKFVELIDGARKITMKDTGHLPMVERPNTFNETLEEFLQHEVVEGELEGDLDGPGATSENGRIDAGGGSKGKAAHAQEDGGADGEGAAGTGSSDEGAAGTGSSAEGAAETGSSAEAESQAEGWEPDDNGSPEHGAASDPAEREREPAV